MAIPLTIVVGLFLLLVGRRSALLCALAVLVLMLAAMIVLEFPGAEIIKVHIEAFLATLI